MIDPVLLMAFLPAAAALSLTPGADMMFSLAQGMRGGRASGVAAAAGASTGIMLHVTLAGLGLGAAIAAVPPAFDAIRVAGALYLLWLAWRAVRTPLDPALAAVQAHPWRDALLVNLSNPKVILFVLALLPQFVDPERPLLQQFICLGAILAASGFAVNATVGASAGTIGRALTRDARWERALRWISAGVFGGLAIRLAAQGRA